LIRDLLEKSEKHEDEMMGPKVSALVPCYNSSAFLLETLDCLAAQTWPNLEILVGDDCSTDDTLAIARKFAEQHDNVQVFDRPQNLGWLGNSNDLMARATGEMCFFAFHDDTVTTDYVEKLAITLMSHPSAILAFSHMSVAELDGRTELHAFPAIVGLKRAFRRGLLMADMPNDWWVPNRGLFRTEAFHRIGGIHRNEAGEFSADWTWLLHMSLLGEFVCVPELLCFKRYQPNSVSKNWPGRMDKNHRALRRAGTMEINGSSIGLLPKVLLKAYLRKRGLMGRLRKIAGVTYGRHQG
jgi:glycosyltransferase involved in cell wall biosynthesis